MTGLVDATSFLALGRVFVANMTGNVAFVGFSLAGAPGFSLRATLLALGGFLVGAFVEGLLAGRTPANRGTLLLNALMLELVLFAIAVAVGQTSAVPYARPNRDSIVALIAVAMGIQSAVARRVAVPDLSTTVLTRTLTALASEILQGNRAALARRSLAVLMMLGGAAMGAVLVNHVRASAALDVAAGLIALVVLATLATTRHQAAWQSE